MVSRRPITPAPSGVIFNPRIRPATARPRTAADTSTGPPTIPPANFTPRSQSASGAPPLHVQPEVRPSTPGNVTTPLPHQQQVSRQGNRAPPEKPSPSPRTLAQRRIPSSRIPIIPLSGVTYRPPIRKPVPPPQSVSTAPTQLPPTARMTTRESDEAVRNLLRSSHLDAPSIHPINKEPSIDFKPQRRSWHPLDSDSPVIRDFGMRHSMQDLTNTREPADDADAIITQEDFDELPGTDHSFGSRHPNRFLANRVDANATRPDIGGRRVSEVSFQENAGPISRGSSGRTRPVSPAPGKGRPKTALERVLGLGNGGAMKKTGGKKERVKQFFKGVFKRN